MRVRSEVRGGAQPWPKGPIMPALILVIGQDVAQTVSPRGAPLKLVVEICEEALGGVPILRQRSPRGLLLVGTPRQPRLLPYMHASSARQALLRAGAHGQTRDDLVVEASVRLRAENKTS